MLFILLGLNIYCCVILCVLMWLFVMHGKHSYSCVIFLFSNMFTVPRIGVPIIIFGNLC
jgi:hypothetical protein